MIRLFRFLRPYRLYVTLGVVLIFLQSLASLYLPNLMSNIVDVGVEGHNVPYIVKVGGFMLLVTILGVICSVLASYFTSVAAAGFGKLLRRDIFTHVENFTLHEFDTIGTSSLIVRTNNDVLQVQQFVNMALRMMVMAPLTAIGGIIMAVYTDARLSLIIVVAMPILGLAIYRILGRGMGLFRVVQTKVDVLNRVLREHLTGIRVIRAFDRSAYEVDRFDAANLDLTDTSVRVYQIMAALMPVMMLLINLSTLAIVWFGAGLIDASQMQIGNMMAFIQYVMQIMFSVMMASMMSFMIPRAQASSVRINEVLDMRPEIRDPEQPVQPTGQHGYIEFRDVSFRYPGAEEPALAHISFAAKPGEITAIIGGTGAGKSTLVNLIPRFYDVASGAILVDGVDIRELGQQELRAKIGLVPQKAVLFNGTIADNLRYGRAEADEEHLQWAVNVAQASAFVAEMKDGLQSFIAQGGANVSGGQKQRLSIARALVRKPEIYIFDDSFSALDYKTDALLRAALKQEIAEATVLLVAQRVSTVIDADRIVVLDEGRAVGIGTHKELLETCAVYREIVASQLSEEEIA